MKTPIAPEDCLNLREVQGLCAIPQHPSIVPVYEAFYDPTTQLFHLVMEHMQQNLYQLIKSRNGIQIDLDCVRSILFQILLGLEHCHKHNYFHRDIKPENILVTLVKPSKRAISAYGSHFRTPPATPTNYQVKLADFGLAREVDSCPPFTTYVSTRWYRAPEVLLRAEQYSSPVDIWAFGAMAFELVMLMPLFPGDNDVDQVWNICQIMGSPGNWRDSQQRSIGGGSWSDGDKLMTAMGLGFPEVAPQTISGMLGPSWPDSISDLITQTLFWNPARRCTATTALQQKFFVEAGLAPPISTIGLPRVERLSLLPWLDDTQMSSIRPRLSTKQIASPKAPLSPVSRNHRHPSVAATISQPVASHRQSWFARKRDSIIGRSIFDAPDMVRSTHIAGQEHQMSCSPLGHTYSHVKPIQRPEQHHQADFDMSSHYAVQAESHTKDVQRRRASEAWNQKRQSISGHEQAHLSKVPVRMPPKELPETRKMVRTISNVSTDHSSFESTHAAQSRLQASESHSGIGNLLAHLRKKHKKLDIGHEEANEETFPDSHSTVPEVNVRTLQLQTQFERKPDPIEVYQDIASSADSHIGEVHMHMHNYTPALRKNASFSDDAYAHTSLVGRISTKNRKASRVELDQHPLQETGNTRDPRCKVSAVVRNVGQLRPAVSGSVETARAMPSYAKSTAASQRRASNIHPASTGKPVSSNASRRATSSRNPAIPMNSFQRSLF